MKRHPDWKTCDPGTKGSPLKMHVPPTAGKKQKTRARVMAAKRAKPPSAARPQRPSKNKRAPDPKRRGRSSAGKKSAFERVTIAKRRWLFQGGLRFADSLKHKINQREGRCCVAAACIVRQQLQQTSPAVFRPGDSTPADILRELKQQSNENVTLASDGTVLSCLPEPAMKVVVSEVVHEMQLSDDVLDDVVAHVAKHACLLPYVAAPTTTASQQLISADQYARKLNSMLNGQVPDDEWHTQAVVGVATRPRSGRRFFVARQSWPGCKVTLIPVLSVKAITTIWKRLGLPRTRVAVDELKETHVALLPDLFTPSKHGLPMKHLNV